MTLPSEDDNVQFNILLEAAQALKELEYLRTDATTLQEVFDAVQAKVDATAKKMGTSFVAMEQNFKDVIVMAERLRAELAAVDPGIAAAAIQANPRMAQLSQVQSPFSGIGQTTGWTEVNAIQKEILKNEANSLKLADATAKEINQQVTAEQRLNAERQKAVQLAQAELDAIMKEDAAIQQQLKNFGNIRRTAQESMQLLRSFSSTQRGQDILTQFFGDYNSATKVTQQVDAIKKSVLSLSKETKTSFAQAGQLIKEQFSHIPGMANQVNQAVKQMGSSFEDGSTKAIKGLDAIRIAMGAIISMILFQVIQAVTSFFSKSVELARQLEDTMYRLGNVEKSLSMEGIEISMKGLEEGIIRIQKRMPIFSREDVSQLVGTLAISTKQLKLTEQQILDLAQAVAVLNVRSEKQEDLSTTAQHVLSSLLTGNAKGITSLGIAFTDNTMRAKAMELGYLEAGEALSTLTENEKGLTKLAIVLESTGQELGSINEYLDTNTATIQQNKAAWADLMSSVGSVFTAMVPNLTKFFEYLERVSTQSKAVIVVVLALRDALVALQNEIALIATSTTNPIEGIKKLGDAIDQIPAFAKQRLQDIVIDFFPAMPANAPDWFKAMFGEAFEKADTMTAEVQIDAEVNNMDDLDELDRKIEEIAIDAQHAREDLAILLDQKHEDLEIKFKLKLEDIDTEYLQKAEDAAIDYAHKIEDINLDAQQKIEDAKNKARLDEQKAEMEFQLKMKELREEFLMDLEDALRARDARQVIRLQKQYALDKQKLIDRKNLEDALRKQQLEADLKAIELERQRRLEEAAREYEQKLQQLAIQKQRELEELNRWKEREQADLALWYERELAEIDRNTQHKLERLLAGYIEEQKIHEESQAAIHEILARWFGQNMALVDQLMAYTMQSFANMAGMAAGVLGGMTAAAPALPGSMGGSAPAPYWDLATQDSGFAEGGTLFADRPTTVTFGEAGPEAATFKPIGRVGRDEGTIFGNLSRNGNGGGKITLNVVLSPDLEARIVQNALGQTADVITKISRMK